MSEENQFFIITYSPAACVPFTHLAFGLLAPPFMFLILAYLSFLDSAVEVGFIHHAFSYNITTLLGIDLPIPFLWMDLTSEDTDS